MTFAMIKAGGSGSNGEDRSGRRGGRESRVEKSEAMSDRDRSSNPFRAREPNRIGEFIQAQLIGMQPGGKPVRLTLRHLEVGNRPGQRIGSQDISQMGEAEVGALALAIYATAESDAIGLGHGTQRYIIQSFDEENPGDPSGRCIFEINNGEDLRQGQGPGGAGGVPDYYDSEPPTEQGVLSSVMSQNKDMHNKIMGVVGTASNMVLLLQNQVDRLMGRLEAEETRRLQNIDMIEKARGESWKREREGKLLDAEVENKRELMGLAKVAVPAILRRIGASDPKQRLDADSLQEINVAMSFADENTFNAVIETIKDEKLKVQFAEWVAFNIERAQKLQRERNGESAPAGQQAAQAQRSLPAAPAATQQQTQAQPTPPTEEQLAAARKAAAEQAKEQLRMWQERLAKIEEQANATEQAQGEAAQKAATDASEPTTPAATTKKSKSAAKGDAAAATMTENKGA